MVFQYFVFLFVVRFILECYINIQKSAQIISVEMDVFSQMDTLL